MARKTGLQRLARRAVEIANTPIQLPGYQVEEAPDDSVEWGQVETIEQSDAVMHRRRLADLRKQQAKRTLADLRDDTTVCLKSTRAGFTVAWSDTLSRALERHLTAAERDAILNASLNTLALRLSDVCREIREAGHEADRERAERIAAAGSIGTRAVAS